MSGLGSNPGSLAPEPTLNHLVASSLMRLGEGHAAVKRVEQTPGAEVKQGYDGLNKNG